MRRVPRPIRLQLKPLLLALFSVFFFQAANMGLFAFIIGLGKRHGLEVAFISETLGIANWFATLGAVLVIVRFHPIWDFQTDHRRHVVDARRHICLQLLRV